MEKLNNVPLLRLEIAIEFARKNHGYLAGLISIEGDFIRHSQFNNLDNEDQKKYHPLVLLPFESGYQSEVYRYIKPNSDQYEIVWSEFEELHNKEWFIKIHYYKEQ